MPRATAKKKRDIPPLYMLVADGGRLDPAFQHDQERLMSFRRGTRLVVTVDPDGSRRGVRKWFAIIGKAVKNSLLPWVTVSAADEAIRLALDLYEPKKANDGSWHRVTQSLNDLSDEELDEQIEAMTALIVKISGVDPDDFKREMHGAGDERFASDYDRPAADNDAGAAAIPLDEIPQSSGEGIGAGDPHSQAAGSDATNSRTARGEPERFYQEVVLTHEIDECLTWPFARDADGYGKMRMGDEMVRVHRRLCEDVHGPAPSPDHEAAHDCGKGHDACVAKKHVVWKTHQENMDDRVAHGTLARGEGNGQSKLTEADVREILRLKGQMTLREIGKKFGVNNTTVGRIHRGENWDWLSESNPDGDLDIGNDADAPEGSAGVIASNSAASATNSAEVTAPETGASPTSSGAVLNATSGTAVAAGEDLTGLSASPAAELSEADRAWLKLGALWMLAALPDKDPEALRVLIVQINEIRKVMPKDVSRDALQRMESMRLHCRRVCDGAEKLSKRFMAETALAMPAEIEPKPIKTTRSGS